MVARQQQQRQQQQQHGGDRQRYAYRFTEPFGRSWSGWPLKQVVETIAKDSHGAVSFDVLRAYRHARANSKGNGTRYHGFVIERFDIDKQDEWDWHDDACAKVVVPLGATCAQLAPGR